MISIKRKILLLVFGLSAGILHSCGPAALKESLEVTKLSEMQMFGFLESEAGVETL